MTPKESSQFFISLEAFITEQAERFHVCREAVIIALSDFCDDYHALEE